MDGIRSTSAPSALISWMRSSVKQSAITISARYPFARHTRASAGPVLPPVYSTTVSPGETRPSRSAPLIIARAIRSFIDPVGFAYSSFSHSSAPFAGAQRRNRTRGVWPIASRIVSTTPPILHELRAHGQVPLVEPDDAREALPRCAAFPVAERLPLSRFPARPGRRAGVAGGTVRLARFDDLFRRPARHPVHAEVVRMNRGVSGPEEEPARPADSRQGAHRDGLDDSALRSVAPIHERREAEDRCAVPARPAAQPGLFSEVCVVQHVANRGARARSAHHLGKKAAAADRNHSAR